MSRGCYCSFSLLFLKQAGMFPRQPENYNPVLILNQMIPGIVFMENIIRRGNVKYFVVKCEINGMRFQGQGMTFKFYKYYITDHRLK